MAKRKNAKDSTALTTTNGGGAVANVSDDPFTDAANEMGGSNSYLNFSGKTGKFTYGQDKEEMELGRRLAVNMNGFSRGHICWKDDSKIDEDMTLIIDGRPTPQNQLPDHFGVDYEKDDTEGWAEQASVPFRDVETGEEYQFNTSSKSGMSALSKLLKEFVKGRVEHGDDLPVIELGAEEFDSTATVNGKKKTFTNSKPVFDIVEWASVEDLQEALGENPADYQDSDSGKDEPKEEKPKKEKGKKGKRGKRADYGDK